MGRIFTPTAETWPATADAVVIGGGIVGVATAFWLSRAGLDTVLLEMRSDLGSLTSAQSIESFRLQFTEPAMSELAQEGIRIHENFAEIIGSRTMIYRYATRGTSSSRMSRARSTA